jgi:hypothetical protein
VLALVIVGFCNVELKLLGPAQLYVAEGTVATDKLNVFVEHKGEFEDIERVVGGGGFTTTVVVLSGPIQPFTLTFTVYTPAPAKGIFVTVGF